MANIDKEKTRFAVYTVNDCMRSYIIANYEAADMPAAIKCAYRVLRCSMNHKQAIETLASAWVELVIDGEAVPVPVQAFKILDTLGDGEQKRIGYRYTLENDFGRLCWVRAWDETEWLAYGEDSPAYDEIEDALTIMAHSRVDVRAALAVLQEFGFHLVSKITIERG